MLTMSDSKSATHVGAIVQFALEGDNREDSKLLSGLVNQVLSLGVNGKIFLANLDSVLINSSRVD